MGERDLRRRQVGPGDEMLDVLREMAALTLDGTASPAARQTQPGCGGRAQQLLSTASAVLELASARSWTS